MDRNARSRRGFLASLGGISFAMLGIPRTRAHNCAHTVLPQEWEHPEPRPGIDASNVLSEAALSGYSHVKELYDGIREIPHIADGLRCMCGCADLPGFRSLLTCFEANGMALECVICQTEGRMVVRYHKEGRTLDQIRAAVTARFG